MYNKCHAVLHTTSIVLNYIYSCGIHDWIYFLHTIKHSMLVQIIPGSRPVTEPL